MKMILPVFKKLIPFFFILILTLVLLFEAASDTPTYDEPANMAAAFAYVYKNDYRLYPDNPPLVKLFSGLTLFPIRNTINFPGDIESYKNPQKFDLYTFGTEFLYRSNNNPLLISILTRLPNILFTIATGLLLYWFAKEMYGKTASLLALFLYSFDPNIRGHGHILAFDLPLAFWVLLVFFLTFRLSMHPKKKVLHTSLIALSFALGFMTKFTMGFVALIYFSGLIFLAIKKSRQLSLKTILMLIAAIVTITFLILWSFGIFSKYNQKTLDYDQVPIIESANKTLQDDNNWNLIKKLPLPYFYKTGLQVMYTHNVVSQPAYLLGEVRVKNDWFFYFPISLMLKTPIPTLVLIFLSIFLLLKTTWQAKKRQRHFGGGTWSEQYELYIRNYFPFIVGLTFMLLMMIFSHVNNVFRYLLPAYIFFILGASQSVNWLASLKKPVRIFLMLNLCFFLLTSFFSFPFDLSYTNEFTGIPPAGYKYLSDSEVDWGQDLERLAKWLKSHNFDKEAITLSYLGTADPAYYGISYKPLKFEGLNNLSGIVAISVGNLTLGDWQWRSQSGYKTGFLQAPLDFLRQKKPEAIIGKSIFVYKF